MPDADTTARMRRILDAVASGEAIRNAIASEGLHPVTFWGALSESPELQRKYEVARECRALMQVADAEHIADTDTDAPRARNRIAVRQWAAERMHRKAWGQKLDVDVTHTVDLGQAIADARANALPMRCQPSTIDVEYTEESNTSLTTTTDIKSVEPEEQAPAALPDLFD